MKLTLMTSTSLFAWSLLILPVSICVILLMRSGDKYLRYVYLLVMLFVVVTIQFGATHRLYRIEGNSMAPTIHDGDGIIVVNGISPKRNDIVVVNWLGSDIIKRAVAIEGDIVETSNGYLRINGQKTDIPCNTDLVVEVPEGSVFVVGDNYNDSIDSRVIRPACFDRDHLVGVARW